MTGAAVEPSRRKVIQIAVAGNDETGTDDLRWAILALCDDGTVWRLRNLAGSWRPLPPVPPGRARRAAPP
jgi:hypothetical protein